MSAQKKYGAWTEADCNAWYEAAKAGLDADGLAPDSAEQVRLGNIRRYCVDDIGGGGRDAAAHNISHLLVMPMIELSRAIDSPHYRTSPQRLASAPLAAAAFPRMIAQSQRYFMSQMILKANPLTLSLEVSGDLGELLRRP